MKDDDIDLSSVNWEHGMFVTPAHFFRQERYMDSALLWVLRNCTELYGLIGAGPRMEPAERGAAKYDPIVDVLEDEESLKVTVSQCRGLTSGGDIVDIDPAHSVHAEFSKPQLEGHKELGVYVTCQPHDKQVDGEFDDAVNPQMRSLRHRRYQVKLDVFAEEADHSVLLTRLVKSERGLRFEKQASFIPPCTTLASHSALTHAWRQLTDQVASLADRYTELHRAVGEYVSLASDRGIDTRGDGETLAFVSRMVVALEECAYEALDVLQSPPRFFQHMYRLVRSAAIYLDLSPPTQAYFQLLAESGETDYAPILQQERQALGLTRDWTVHTDLSLDVQRISGGLHRLQRLEEALEGKYIDFRVSPSLEALHFVFDRGGEAFYQAVSKPSRPQAFGQELTFVFARLKLEGRETYRIILIGDPDTQLEIGELLSAEIRLNPGGGQTLKPIYKTSSCDIPEQRNFALDFDAPAEVLTISDMRVIVKATQPIRSALIYIRRRFYARQQPSTISQGPRPEPAPRKPDPVPKYEEPSKSFPRSSRLRDFDEGAAAPRDTPDWGGGHKKSRLE